MEALIFTGHLGRHAEVRHINNGDPVVGFSVAVKRGWGENERTIWYDCSWFGERAEKAAQWLSKGKQVAVQGRPDARAWMPRDGSSEPRCGLECRVERLDFLGGPQGEGITPAPAEAPAEDGPY